MNLSILLLEQFLEQIISLNKGYKANELDFIILFQNLEVVECLAQPTVFCTVIGFVM